LACGGDKPAGLRLRLRIVLPRWGNDIPTKMLFLQAVVFSQNFATPTATLSQSVKHNWVALLPDITQWRSH
ncbi:hypothetical protein, partial [Glaesserella parasuis]|uniref:hypothetical protein n=1 Tax=Glaesserella parasuis TaxID=738 RepID=UPI003B6772A2